MRRTYALGILVLACLVTPATTAQAQFHPGQRVGRGGGNNNYGYSDAGVWGLYSSNVSQAAARNVAQQNKMMGQAAAMGQSAMMQSNVQNSLISQAQMQSQDLMSQRQANKDWWFQVQQQQLSQPQQRSMAARPSVAMAPGGGFEAATLQTSGAATDIIKWPPILCDTRFTEDRAKVEAPYRRDPNVRANPTTADYQNMIDATERMKAGLGQMAAAISAQEYLYAVQFLDQLATEARGRIEKTDAASER